MAISWVKTGTVTFSGASSVSVQGLTGLEDGDIAIMHIADSVSSNVVNTHNGSGWALVGWIAATSGSGARAKCSVFWKRVVGTTEASMTAFGGTSWMGSVMRAYRGCIASGNPIDDSDVFQLGGLSGLVTWPQVTSSVANAMLVLCNSAGDNNSNVSGYSDSAPGSPTERYDQFTASGNDGSIVGADHLLGAAATISSIQANRSTAEQQANVSLILLPEVVGAPFLPFYPKRSNPLLRM